MIRLYFILLLAVLTWRAGANPDSTEGLYGPEFTFTLNGQVPRETKVLYINHLRHHLTEFQPPGARFTEDWDNSETVFHSPNGWWFRVSDNPGVLEIQMKPLSVNDTRRFKADIQDAIFASAAAVGLFPWDYLGGGHLNLDNRVFGGSLLLARNFIVDFWNHSELAMGIFNYDTNNALPLALYQQKEIDRIREIITKADRGEYGDGPEAIERFFNQIDEVLTQGKSYFGDAARGKHHDLNFHRGRVEIRSVRPQANMDVWLNQIELIESRIIKYLRPMSEPIPLKFRIPARFPLKLNDAPDNNFITPPLNPQRALKSFHAYVTESGLEWSNHREYIWPNWKAEELRTFECERGLQP